MVRDEWQRRIGRAEELCAQFTFAAEVLRFYAAVARFQQKIHEEFGQSMDGGSGTAPSAEKFSRPLPPELMSGFGRLLSLVEENGPDALQNAAHELGTRGDDFCFQLLTAFWNRSDDRTLELGPNDFFARAYLQPYAVGIRSGFRKRENGPTAYLCPFCGRRPGGGVLRPLGDGGQRSLVCSFCLGEWEFRRIVCPGCREEDHAKLPVYTPEDFKHVRIEACDSCRQYIKTVDLTRNGLADPVVDEIASIPLDLWAQKQGYTKLQTNLMLL
jgi:FdhE protein